MQFFFFVTLVQMVLLGAHFLVYEVVELSFTLGDLSLFILRIFFLLASVSFVASWILTHGKKGKARAFLYNASSLWLGFFVYFLLASVLFPVIAFFTSSYEFLPIPVLGLIFYALALFLGLFGIYNANRLVVTPYTVVLPKLPREAKGLRIVFVSDIHIGLVRGVSFLSSVIKMVNDLEGDVVIIGGDLFDGDPVGEEVAHALKDIKAAERFFVTGNHETYGPLSEYLSLLKKVGIQNLSNEERVVRGVTLLGAAYEKTEQEKDFVSFLEKSSGREGAILIKHVPVGIGEAARLGVSLMLSGHTHRGQMFPFSFITKRMYRGFDYGLKKFGNLNVVTSSGAGTWGPPLRVGTRAEIVLITLKSE